MPSNPDDEVQYIEVDHFGFLRLDNVIVDRILPVLTPIAQTIYIRIFRQTLGYRNKKQEQKEWDTIAHSQFKKWCHIKAVNTIKTAINRLEELNLIEVESLGVRKPSRYKINLEEIKSYRDDEYEHPLYQNMT